MTHHTRKTGYSLVEVLVSISVLLIAIVGPMTIASQGIKSASFALEQNTAFFLAQEGIEAIFALRGDYALQDIADGPGSDTSWDWIGVVDTAAGCNISSTPCSLGIDFRDDSLSDNMVDCNSSDALCQLYSDGVGRAVYVHNGTDASQYTRVVTIQQTSAYIVQVTSKVTWNSRVYGNAPQNVTLTTEIFDLIQLP